MEQEHVYKVYKIIAAEFDNTRYSKWGQVRVFLDALPKYSYLGDIGCGNGKYSNYRSDIIWHGVDTCLELLNCFESDKLILANGLNLPYKTECFDAVISIAVIHHLSTIKKRHQFIKELIRTTKKGGQIYFMVWGKDQNIKKNWKNISGNDYLIPWKNQEYRYYHLFEESEIKELCKDLIYSMIYEKDNWCVTITN